MDEAARGFEEWTRAYREWARSQLLGEDQEPDVAQVAHGTRMGCGKGSGKGPATRPLRELEVVPMTEQQLDDFWSGTMDSEEANDEERFRRQVVLGSLEPPGHGTDSEAPGFNLMEVRPVNPRVPPPRVAAPSDETAPDDQAERAEYQRWPLPLPGHGDPMRLHGRGAPDELNSEQALHDHRMTGNRHENLQRRKNGTQPGAGGSPS
jgi:hypothetical protein